MRIEGCQHVSRTQDRRKRPGERRGSDPERRQATSSDRRARHAAHQWFMPAFGAQILGQMNPEPVSQERFERAYLQPEARTPLRPSLVKTA